VNPLFAESTRTKPWKLAQTEWLWGIGASSPEGTVKSPRPGGPEALKVKPDGRIMNGNTRIKALGERGLDMNSLPREALP
jgi:hypothetical protein